jgi:hypothetical protein
VCQREDLELGKDAPQNRLSSERESNDSDASIPLRARTTAEQSVAWREGETNPTDALPNEFTRPEGMAPTDERSSLPRPNVFGFLSSSVFARHYQSWLVGDRRFVNQLDHIRYLKQFLFQEKVQFKADQLREIDLGTLNNLQFGRNGRVPTDEEWRLLDEKLAALATYLTDDLRRRIRIHELATFFGPLPLLFLFAVVLSTASYLLYGHVFKDVNSLSNTSAYLFSLIVWTAAQGGLGACAFLNTTVIIKKPDVVTNPGAPVSSIDITDENVLKTRIILGALFGFLIGLPLSYQSLQTINGSLLSSATNFNPPTPTATQIAIMLVPFLLGFSTNLVLVILERCVASIQAFFGIVSEKH